MKKIIIVHILISFSFSFILCKELYNYFETCFGRPFPADIYLLKVKNKNTKTRCEICSKLTIKIPE